MRPCQHWQVCIVSRARKVRRKVPRSRVVVLSRPIRDDDSARTKEGAVRRRLVVTTGQCPCGGRLVMPDVVVPGTVVTVAVEHEPGCPAIEGK